MIRPLGTLEHLQMRLGAAPCRCYLTGVPAAYPTCDRHQACLPVQVARLRQRLEALGVDVDALVADIVAAGEAGQEELGDLT